MSMETISVEGKEYVKAKEIARELGYTTDYIGQLCRANKIDAKLVGRSWYVDPDSVRDHKDSRYRSVKETSKRGIEEKLRDIRVQQQSEEKSHFYEHRSYTKKHTEISYLNDEADLFPTPVKQYEKKTDVTLPVNLADAEKVQVEERTDKEYHFEAPEREETVFYGTLEVKDYETEVPVEGDKEAPAPVEVKRATLFKTESQPLAELHEEDTESAHRVAIKMNPTQERFHQRVSKPKKESTALPVSADEEMVRLPISFHIMTASIVVVGLFIATALVGLETEVTTNAGVLTSAFSFAIDNVTALIYLIK